MGRARGVRARRVSGIVRSRDESRRGKVRVVSLCKWDERSFAGRRCSRENCISCFK